MQAEQGQMDTALEEISLSIECRGGTQNTATISPVFLSPKCVRGTVNWDESDPSFSILSAESDGETAWGQRLLLVWAAAGSHNASEFPFIAADRWSLAVLSLPDLFGEKGDIVRVTVDARNWRVALEVTCQPSMNTEQQVPAEFRHLDVGIVMAEMTSRLLLGHTWQTQELIPDRTAA